jgi:ribosomal protein L7/L12
MKTQINEIKRMQELAGLPLQEAKYRFNDANDETVEELVAKLKPVIESALKSQLVGALNKVPELKNVGAQNVGLAVGLIAFDIANNV